MLLETIDINPIITSNVFTQSPPNVKAILNKYIVGTNSRVTNAIGINIIK